MSNEPITKCSGWKYVELNFLSYFNDGEPTEYMQDELLIRYWERVGLVRKKQGLLLGL